MTFIIYQLARKPVVNHLTCKPFPNLFTCHFLINWERLTSLAKTTAEQKSVTLKQLQSPNSENNFRSVLSPKYLASEVRKFFVSHMANSAKGNPLRVRVRFSSQLHSTRIASACGNVESISL